MIILTPEQANHIRGLTVKGHALAPMLLANGNLSLPNEVLSDPAHAVHKAYIQANCLFMADSSFDPGAPVDLEEPGSPIAGSSWEQDPVKVAPHVHTSEWKEGEIVVVP